MKNFKEFLIEGKEEEKKKVDFKKDINGKQLNRSQIEVIEYGKDYNIDVSDGWFIFGEETDKEL